MTNRRLIGPVTLLILLTLATSGARAEGEGKYPDWGGQWFRTGGIQFDPTKPLGRGQQAPLTPEYQAKFEASLADIAAGGLGLNEHTSCLPHGLPRMMNVIYPMEFIVQPNITYILFEDNLPRRIYTDGRSWPAEAEPSFAGYSIGHWVDEAGEGRFGVPMNVAHPCRSASIPRTFEASGLPLHEDNPIDEIDP